MKVLLISHNVFSTTESMGKTLSSYFSKFDADELAQLYFHAQVPTTDVCNRYYRITDKEAIKSIFGWKAGGVVSRQKISLANRDSRIDEGVTATIYQRARKRTPIIYLARNLWWRLAHWNNNQLKKWLDDYNPDCIFFASGDYSFSYNVALKIAKERNIPLYVSCMDDFYFYNKNEKSFLGRLQHKFFMRIVYKTMARAKKIFCICDKMSEDYAKLFDKECITVHTPSTINKPLEYDKRNKISYLGNLGYKRNEQLIDIGRALRSLNLELDHIDVYSTETRKEILDDLTIDNGIEFHGAIGAEDVLKVMGESLAVIHTESFDENIRKSVKYSVSTKIADSLSSGTCIFAYGPEEVASIEYLRKNNAAICCNDKNTLEQALRKLLTEEDLREKVVKNAKTLADKNHAVEITPMIILKELYSLDCDSN